MLTSDGSSFLKTGVTSANFHRSGNIPNDRDRLNRRQREQAICGAISLRSLPGILSGPEALLGSMVFSAFSTSDAVRCMFDNKFSVFIHVG